MKKFLSGLLVFALTFGCCEPCLVYGAKVEQDQITASNNEKENKQKEFLIKFLKSAQEKEIKAIKQRLKEFNSKQFKEIGKIKHMSKPRYFLYKLSKYLGSFLRTAFVVGVPVVCFIYGKKSGSSYGFQEGEEKSSFEDQYSESFRKGYAIGFKEGNSEFDYKHWWGEDSPIEVDVNRLLTLASRLLPYEVFKRYNIFYKNGTKFDNFYKDTGMEVLWRSFNDIKNKIILQKNQPQKNQHQNFGNTFYYNFDW